MTKWALSQGLVCIIGEQRPTEEGLKFSGSQELRTALELDAHPLLQLWYLGKVI